MYPVEVPSHFRLVAELWHDGQTSAMYSVLSTGYIHDSGYRALLEAELSRCIRQTREKESLENFLKWVESLPEDEE